MLGVSVVIRGTTLMISRKVGPHYCALLSERTITTRSDAVRPYSYTGDWRIFAKFEHFSKKFLKKKAKDKGTLIMSHNQKFRKSEDIERILFCG